MNLEPLLAVVASGVTKYVMDGVKFVCERRGWLCQFSPEGVNLGIFPKAMLLLTVPVSVLTTLGVFALSGLPIQTNLMFAVCTTLGATGYHETSETLKSKG